MSTAVKCVHLLSLRFVVSTSLR